jgi:hypothetical protein
VPLLILSFFVLILVLCLSHFFPSFVVSFSCVLLCSLNKEKVTAEAGVNDYESWASVGGECVTRGPFGWSKTTPAGSFAAFGPTF